MKDKGVDMPRREIVAGLGKECAGERVGWVYLRRGSLYVTSAEVGENGATVTEYTDKGCDERGLRRFFAQGFGMAAMHAVRLPRPEFVKGDPDAQQLVARNNVDSHFVESASNYRTEEIITGGGIWSTSEKNPLDRVLPNDQLMPEMARLLDKQRLGSCRKALYYALNANMSDIGSSASDLTTWQAKRDVLMPDASMHKTTLGEVANARAVLDSLKTLEKIKPNGRDRVLQELGKRCLAANTYRIYCIPFIYEGVYHDEPKIIKEWAKRSLDDLEMLSTAELRAIEKQDAVL